MGLREQIAADTKAILEDQASGFGYPITLTDPLGNTADLVGFSNDISQVIDPDTGTAVSGRAVECTLAIKSITDAGLSLPQGIANVDEKPWTVSFTDINGNAGTFKVFESVPDRAMGTVILALELWGVITP